MNVSSCNNYNFCVGFNRIC